MKKIMILGCFLSAFATTTQAQKYLGVATSNWSGITGMYLNPAYLADNKAKICIDIFSVNVGIDNNLGKVNTNPGISRFLSGSNNDINDVFAFSGKDKFSLLAPYADVKGPGIMYSINHKHTVAFSTRFRGFNQFNNFDQTIYRSITDSSYTANGDIRLVAQNFNWTAHLWAEYSLSYGGVLYDRGHHTLKAGITLRMLNGIGFFGLKGNNLDANYLRGADSFYANNTDLQYSSNIFKASNALKTEVSPQSFFDQYFGNGGSKGLGGDAGLVYEYTKDPTAYEYEMDGDTKQKDHTANRYTFRFAASITDFGSILYKKDKNSAINISGNGYITGRELTDNVQNVDDFRALASRKGFSIDTTGADSRLYMPTTLVLSGDYHAYKHFYVNATFIANVANRMEYGNSYYNQVTITPRYDRKRYSLALPITYNSLAGNARVGFGARYSGFFIGSDDVLGVVSSNQYGLNVYVGGHVPINFRKAKDHDNDKVSDGKDKCPDEMGSWATGGCPEKDDK